MAKEPMRKIELCARQDRRKMILERLQELGCVEIRPEPEGAELYEMMDVSGARNAFQKKVNRAEQALEILEQYAPEQRSLFQTLAGKPVLAGSFYSGPAERRSEYSKTAEKLIRLEEELREQQTLIRNAKLRIDELQPWEKLDVAMTCPGTRRCSFFAGMFPARYTQEELLAFVTEKKPELRFYELQILYTSANGTWTAVVCIREAEEELKGIFRSHGFSGSPQLLTLPPAEEEQRLWQQIGNAEERILLLEEQIREMEEEREHLRLLSDYYRVRAEKYEALGFLSQTREVFALEGYVPAGRAEDLRKELTERFGATVELEDIPEGEQAPVLLRNNRFARTGEGVLASFGLPKAGETDPTAVMTGFYVFLFGLMLADAAYGAIIAAACGAALLKFPRMEENLRKSLGLFFWCGLSSLFWGILFGGYFGDAPDIIAGTFFGVSIPEGQSVIPALWFVPLGDPMRLLMYSLLFGCIHLFTGLGIKGYLCIRNRDYTAFVCDVIFWFLLIFGLLFLLIPSSMFASMFGIRVSVSPAFSLISGGMAAGGALGILLTAGRRKGKAWGIRLALGAYDLYNVTGWLSDILSYSRLLALGLATGVIASVVNQMGSMFGNSVFGVLLFLAVFAVGHTFNLAINLLGAYVHTCRLQYVEFFGKFYEGGGKAFVPFALNTKYVDMKGEHQK